MAFLSLGVAYSVDIYEYIEMFAFVYYIWRLAFGVARFVCKQSYAYFVIHRLGHIIHRIPIRIPYYMDTYIYMTFVRNYYFSSWYSHIGSSSIRVFLLLNLFLRFPFGEKYMQWTYTFTFHESLRRCTIFLTTKGCFQTSTFLKSLLKGMAKP